MEYEKIIVIERVLFMSFFSDLGKAFSSSGSNNVQVQNTNSGADISKLNRTINENKSKIENTYKEIGNIYFSIYGENPAPELAEKVNFIKQLTKDIEKADEEIKLLSGYIHCPKCGVLVKNTDFVCYNCGERLRAPEVDNHCPGCGAEMVPNASFCTKCGRPVTAVQQPQQSQQPAAYQQPQQTVTYQQPQQPQQTVTYQQPQQPQQTVTYQQTSVEQPSPVQPEITQQENPNVKVCHSCGYEMDASNAFCLRCGEKL